MSRLGQIAHHLKEHEKLCSLMGRAYVFMPFFCLFQAKFPRATMRRSDDDAQVSRDTYDTKIGLFWVELAKTKPTGESGREKPCKRKSSTHQKTHF